MKIASIDIIIYFYNKSTLKLVYVHFSWFTSITWTYDSEFFKYIKNLGSTSISKSEFSLDERGTSLFRFFNYLYCFLYYFWIFVLFSFIVF